MTTERPGIDLRITGKNLLLSGTFAGWQSRLVLGPDLDDVGISLFVDSTSVQGGDLAEEDKLFTFRSRTVDNLGKGRYRVVGDFTGAQPSREMSLEVETPLGHTAIIALSFAAQRKDFGDHWQSLVENTTLFGGERPTNAGPQREAAGWLTVPNVAAA
jgi:polyisoprenoid-binding protein YceI